MSRQHNRQESSTSIQRERTRSRNSSIIIMTIIAGYVAVSLLLGVPVLSVIPLAWIFLTALSALLVLHFGTVQTSNRVGIFGAWFALVYASTLSTEFSYLMVSSYLVLLLVALIELPKQDWLVLGFISILAIWGTGYLRWIEAVDLESQQAVVRHILEQTATTLIGGLFINQLFRRNVKLVSELQTTNRELLARGSELSDAKATIEHNSRIMRHVMENIPARLFYSKPDGTLEFTNGPNLHSVSGKPMVGRPSEEYMPAERLKQFRPHMERARNGRASEFELARYLPDSGEHIERFAFHPHIVDGEVAGIFTIAMDVTDARKLERAMAQTQKLEGLGLLAGGIAHDFNNLLAAILGQSSLAQAKLDSEHPALRHVDRSVDAARRAAKLTKQMLAYSGNGAFTIEEIDVNALIEDNLALFRVSLPSHVMILTQLGKKLPRITVDASQLQQLVMNLVINAGQAFGERASGTVTVRTCLEHISAEPDAFWDLTGEPMHSGDYLLMEIADDGCGMDAATLAQIFDPFFTTKKTGTGLGLAATIGIVRGHKGGITVRSQPNVGTTFSVYFPVSAEKDPVQLQLGDLPSG